MPLTRPLMLAACSRTPCRRAFSRGRTPATTTLTAQAGVRLSSPWPPPASPTGDRQARLSSSNSRWKQRQGSDVFAREAKVQGLKSRAAFKLLEVCLSVCLATNPRDQSLG